MATIHPSLRSFRTSGQSRNMPHREPTGARADRVVPGAAVHQSVADMLAQVERAQLVEFTRRTDVVPFLQEGARAALRELDHESDHLTAERQAGKSPHRRLRKSRSKE